MRKLLFAIALLLSLNIHAEEDEHEKLPEGILSFNYETEEFSLKPNVLKNFSISYAPMNKVGLLIKVTPSSLVRSLDETSIFVHQKGKFRSVIVKVQNSAPDFYLVSCNEVLEGSEIVNQGTNFLKTIQLALEEGPSEGHGH